MTSISFLSGTFPKGQPTGPIEKAYRGLSRILSNGVWNGKTGRNKLRIPPRKIIMLDKERVIRQNFDNVKYIQIIQAKGK